MSEHENGRDLPDGMERRHIPAETAEMRLHEGEDGPGRLDGYGAVFNSRSVLLPGPNGRMFREVIRPGAFEGVMGQGDRDVISARNHDPDNLLGRESNGTLSLEVDDTGLRYHVDLPDTTVGRDTAALVERQDIKGSSFTFRVPEDGDDFRREDGEWIREIHEIAEVGEVGPVTSEAYEDTVVSARAERRAREVMAADAPEMPENRQSRPDFDGTEDISPEWADGAWDRPALRDHPEAGEDAEWGDLPEGDRAAIAGRFIVGTADADTYGNLGYPVVNPATDNLNRNGVLAARQRASAEGDTEVEEIADALWEEFYGEEEDGRALLLVGGALVESRQTDQDLRDRIRSALQERFGGEDVFVWIGATFMEQNEAVFRREEDGEESGLFRIGFEVTDDGVELGEPVEVQRVTTFEPVEGEGEGAGEEAGERSIDITRMRRKQRQAEAEAGLR